MTLKKTEYEIPTILPDIPNPYLYFIIITPLSPRKATAGGILLPSGMQDMEAMGQQLGVLVAKGPDAFKDSVTGESRYDPEPEVGDVVLYSKFSGAGRVLVKEVSTTNDAGVPILEDIKFIIVPDKSILMKLDNPTGYKLH